MRLRFPFVLLAALAAFAIPAGSAFASTAAFTSPVSGSTISQDVTFTVDTSGDAGVGGVDFYVDNGSGDYRQGMFIGSGAARGSGVYSLNANGTTLANNDGPITIDANVVDTNGQSIEALSENLTLATDVAGPSVTSVTPAADAVVSGTVAFSIAATDQDSFTGEYSVDGTTWIALTDGGHGSLTASIDTSALPNGDLYLMYRLTDSVTNTTEDSVHLVVQNLHAPTITPNTLTADKARFRTDETQLETGDIVEAYGMQADGYPAPTITYVWHLCPAGGGACTNVPADVHGDYTVQPGDVGATLSLIAKATNSQGSDSATVPFGVIAQGYVAPTITPGTFTAVDSNGHSTLQIGDTLEVTHAPAYTGANPAPATNYTWAICNGNTCRTANGPTYTVQADDAGADITVYADVSNAKGSDSASVDLGSVASPPAAPAAAAIETAPPVATPPVVVPPVVVPPVVVPPVVVPPLVVPPLVTPAERKAIDVARKTVVAEKVAAVKAQAAAVAAQKRAIAEEKKADAAVNKVAAANATAHQKQHVFVAVSHLLKKQDADAAKLIAARDVAARAARLKANADQATADAGKQLALATTRSDAEVAAAKKKLAAAQKANAGVAKMAAAATAKVTRTKKAARVDVTAAKAKVHVAVVAVSAGQATPIQEQQVVAAVTTSVVAKGAASQKAGHAAAAAKKLKDAKTKLSTVQAAAHKP